MTKRNRRITGLPQVVADREVDDPEGFLFRYRRLRRSKIGLCCLALSVLLYKHARIGTALIIIQPTTFYCFTVHQYRHIPLPTIHHIGILYSTSTPTLTQQIALGTCPTLPPLCTPGFWKLLPTKEFCCHLFPREGVHRAASAVIPMSKPFIVP